MRRATALAVPVRKLSRSISGAIYFQNVHHSWKLQKNTKTLYFGGLRSFKVTDVGVIKNLVTSVCYNKQYVCGYLQLVLR